MNDPLAALVLEQLRPAVAQMVAEAVREALAQSSRAVWIPKAEAARRGYGSASTLRALVAAGKLSRGRNGRVSVAELDALMGAGHGPAPRAPVEPKTADLAAERAKRAAAAILGRGR